MIKQSKTLGGMWSNFLDLLTLSARSMEKTLVPATKKLIEKLISMVNVFKEMSPVLKTTIFLFGLFLSVVGPLLIVFASIISLGRFVANAFLLIAVSAKGAQLSTLGWVVKFGLMGVAMLAVIAILALLVEDIVAFVKGQKSLVGKFIEPWETLKPKLNAAIKPFLILLEDALSNIKGLLMGIAEFMTGVFTDDIEKSTKGLEKIIINFLNLLGNVITIVLGLLWKLLKSIVGAILQWGPRTYKIMKRGLQNAVISLGNVIVKTLDKVIGTIKNKLKSLGLEKLFDFDIGAGFAGINNLGGAFKIPSSASDSEPMFNINGLRNMASSMSNMLRKDNSKSISVNANIQTFVPEGTPQYQAESLVQTSKNAAEEVFNTKINNLFTNIPEIE